MHTYTCTHTHTHIHSHTHTHTLTHTGLTFPVGEADKDLLHGAGREAVAGHTQLPRVGLQLAEEEGEGMGAGLVEGEEEPQLSPPALLQTGTGHQPLHTWHTSHMAHITHGTHHTWHTSQTAHTVQVKKTSTILR